MNKINITKEKIRLVLITFISVISMGMSLSVLNLINWGTDPFTYMNIGIADRLNITFGNWQILLNITMFIPVIIWGRKHIGIGTIFNMILVGYSMDFFSWIWLQTGLNTIFRDILIKIVIMIPALAIFVFSAATYMSTDMGTSPYDALPFMLSAKIPKIPFKYIRFCWDSTAVIIGFVITRKLGIVTVAMTLFLGQAVSFVKEKFFKN